MCHFSDKLKKIRIKTGLSQRQLAEKLGVSQNAICNWENGKREPKFETIKEIADLFDVPISYFWNDTPLNSSKDFLFSDSNTAPIDTKNKSDVEILKVFESIHPASIEEIEDMLEHMKILQTYKVKSTFWEYLQSLNEQGQEEAVKRVRDLTYNPEYQRKAEAPASDRPPAEPPANEGQPPAGADPHQGNAQDNNQDNE